MAIVVETLVPRASQAQHDQFAESMEESMGQLGGPPAGLMVHFSRPARDGFVICEVWRAEAEMRSFYDSVVLPGLAAAGFAPEEPSVSQIWGFARP